MRLALDMYEFGEQMARSGLRRRHPHASDEEIAQMLGDWRRSRPGAPGGDAVGRPSRRFG
jgi:Rv0078B-related antitoxin